MLSLSTCLVALAVGMPGDIEVIKFTAEWCGPCRAMEPVMKEVQRQGVKVRSIDVDAKPELAKRYNVHSLPTLFLVANNKIVDRIDGSIALEALQSRISQAALLAPVSPTRPARAAQPERALPGARRGDRSNPARQVSQNSSRGQSLRSEAGPTRPAPAARSSSEQMKAAERRAFEASVRLKVEDPHGHSYGSGTIVDVHGRHGLVLTCGHVFRDSQGKGTITVDLFAGGRPISVPGELLRYDLDRDLALVGIQTDARLRPAVVAGSSFHVAPGQRLFSVGCNRGKQPTILRGQLKQVNKYLGPENLVVSGSPVDGRSGGGLFTYDGRLVGVCNAADPELNEGLYAAFASVHRHLDDAKLGFVYRRSGADVQLASHESEARSEQAQAAESYSATAAPRAASPRTAPPQIARARNEPPRRSVTEALNAGRTESPQGGTRRPNLVGDVGNDRLAGGRTALAPDDAEIICIIRRNGQPRSEAEVVVLDRPSRQFLNQLSEEQDEQQNRQMTDLRVRRNRESGSLNR